MAIEVTVFTASGLRCPLTALATRNSDGRPVSDTFFPERLTRHTLRVFAPILVGAVVLLVGRFWLG